MKPDEDVQVWLHRFDACRIEERWSDDRAIRELRKYLLMPDINVLNLLETMEPGFTFDRACWKIMQNHGYMTSQGSYGIAFQRRRQQPNESVVTFAAELHDLARKAYPDQTASPFYRDVFIAGLRNDNTRTEVLKRNFTNARDAIELATQLEELELAQRPQPALKVAAAKAPNEPTPRPTSENTSVAAANFSRQRENQAQFRSNKSKQSQPKRSNSDSKTNNRNSNAGNRPSSSADKRNGPRQPKPDDICRNCGGRGHFINSCPSPRFL